MSSQAPTILFGTAGIVSSSDEALGEIFKTLKEHNVKDLDTASSYASSEEILGKHEAPQSFTIHTKAPGFQNGALSKQSVLSGIENSLKHLGVSSVETYFLHAPDATVPIEETLSAIQEIYSAGKFKNFGLSNFSPAEVQKVYDIQKAAGSVLPTVFQGNYNAVSRHIESTLFPLLHKLKIRFFAYSPIAGGFLVKSADALRTNQDEGRFSPNSQLGPMYTTMYGKETLYQALDDWAQIADSAGISKAALAYRWIAYHSALKKENGDGVIVGASKVVQLEETLKAIEAGPLDAETAKKVDDIWKKVEHEAPLDNYHNSHVEGFLAPK